MLFTLPFSQHIDKTDKNDTDNEQQPNLVKTAVNHSYYIQLVNELAATKSAMDLIYSNFENVVDPDLIDCCIYEMNAVQKRYKFLLNRVKQLETP